MSYKTGQEIKSLEVQVEKYTPYYYAGASGDFNPIHIDNDFAKMVGLGSVILQGLCTMAYVYRGAVGDNDPGSLKRLRVRFRQMVRPDDKLTIKGKVTGIENNKTTVELIAENQKGEQVITSGLAILEN